MFSDVHAAIDRETEIKRWRAWVLEQFANRQLHEGVADALARLKQAAERP
jgi:hypothetical protein